jgi:hypothetical protein
MYRLVIKKITNLNCKIILFLAAPKSCKTLRLKWNMLYNNLAFSSYAFYIIFDVGRLVRGFYLFFQVFVKTPATYDPCPWPFPTCSTFPTFWMSTLLTFSATIQKRKCETCQNILKPSFNKISPV